MSFLLSIGVVAPGEVSAELVLVEDPVQVVGGSPAPLGVSGDVVLEPLVEGPTDVLREPPVDPPVPPDPVVPRPEVEGFDPDRSVENVDERDRFASSFSNVDGTTTTVLSELPVNFVDDAGEWQPIDARLVPVSAARDVFVMAANSWSVEFSSAGARVRGDAGTEVLMDLGADVKLPVPLVSDDGLAVLYPGVWPGVDLRFVVDAESVRKEFVLHNAEVPSAFLVRFEGLDLAATPDSGLEVRGDPPDDVRVGAPEVFNRDGVPVNERALPAVRAEAAPPVDDGGVSRPVTMVDLSVDAEWLGSLQPKDFPVVVDPTLSIGAATDLRYAMTNNSGFYCPQNPNCARPRIGNSLASGDTIWRSVFAYDYRPYLPTSTVGSKLVAATMDVSYYSGTTGTYAMALRHATSYNYCGVHLSGNCGLGYSPVVDAVKSIGTGSLSFDVESVMQNYWVQDGALMAWAFSGDESSGVYTFKQLTASLSITYDRLPIVSATGVSPSANPYTFHNHLDGISLSVPAQTEPDGETLYYRFKLCPTASWTGCGSPVKDSGWITANSWSQFAGLPAGWYNQQYYWGVQVSNLTSTNYTLNSSWLRPWKLYNNAAPTPQLVSPSSGFQWAPNVPAELTFTTPEDSDGDTVRYRAVVRKKGTTGAIFTSDWTALLDPGAITETSITVPGDAPLEGGVEYEWTVEFQDQVTKFHWYHYKGQPQGIQPTARTAQFETRYGDSGPSPMQRLGPVSVNLATGNVVTSISTPQVSSLGGSMGASLSYNSRAQDTGLRAQLVNNTNSNFAADSGEQVTYQTDPQTTFQWSNPTATPGISNLMATWTGYITVPADGNYTFAATLNSDEDVEIKVGSTYVMRANRSASAHTTGATIPFGDPLAENPSQYYAHSNVTTGSTPVWLTAYTPYPIKIVYRNPGGAGQLGLYTHSTGSYFAEIPPSWLTPDAPVVPRGWTFNHSEALGAVYTKAEVTANEVILTYTDGSTAPFTRNSDSYKAPPGLDDIVTVTDGKVTVTDITGTVHQFHADGHLESVSAPIDSITSAAPTLTWSAFTPSGSTPSQRLTAQTDPISGHQVTYTYQGLGTCPTSYAGVTHPTPRPGMLCKINYPDGTNTSLYYATTSAGEPVLSRIVDPGDEIYDLGYDNVSLGNYTVPMIDEFRDPLMNDLITWGGASVTNSNDYKTLITYDAKGRAETVTAPKAKTTDTQRQNVTIDYRDVGGVTVNETWVLVDGLDTTSTTDWDRKVTFDDLARVNYAYQALNTAATQFSLTETRWHDWIDRPEVVSTDGYTSTFIYNYRNELIDTYGPARTSCFDLTTTSTTYKQPKDSGPEACTSPAVPHATTEYDTTLNTNGTSSPWTGLGVSWWNNTVSAGKPYNRTTGLGGSATTLSYDWTSGHPTAVTANDFSFQADGEIWFTGTGGWPFEVTGNTDDKITVTIDGQTVVTKNTGTTTATGTYTVDPDANLMSGSNHIRRLAIRFNDVSGNAKMTIKWTPPGGSKVNVPISALRPAYSLATRTTVHDSGSGAPTTVTHTSYDTGGLDPALGIATEETIDPQGLALVTELGYETSGYRRQTSRSLPSGATSTLEYYATSGTGSTAATNVSCTTQNDTTVHQGANVNIAVAATAANGDRVLTETVYDVWGRTVAERDGVRNGTTDTWETSWTCITYDTRGRVTTASIPANAAAPARTITHNHAVGGDPRSVSTTDAAGTISATTDLIGRSLTYSDVWGVTSTNTYDAQTGRLTSTVSSTGTLAFTYDRGGRVTDQKLNGTTIATPTYNGPGGTDPHSLASVAYPAGTGNGTSGTFARNSNGQRTNVTWTTSGGGSATITHLGTENASSGSSASTSLTIDRPTAAGDGDVAVASISFTTPDAISAPTGWQLADSEVKNGIATHVLVKVLGASEPSDYTFTLGNNARIVGAISAYSGVDTTTPVDVTATAYSSPATSHDAPSVTATGDNEMLIVAYGVRAPTSLTMPSGTTERSDIATSTGTNDITAAVADRPINTGASGTTTATSGASGYNATVTIALTPATTGSATIASDAVTRSRTGRITDRSIDGTDANPTGNNYTYDAAGRLTEGWANGTRYTYAFAASGGCGAATAGKNTNRTSVAVNGTTTATYCYDNADRLTAVTSSTAPYTDYANNTIAYDAHGNTTELAGQELVYDQTNRHIATYAPNQTSPTTSVVYQRDAFDRIISRTETTNGGGSANITHVGTENASSGSAASSTLTIDRPTAAGDGDVAVAAISLRSSSSITAPTGWQLADSAYKDGIGTHVLTKVLGTSEPSDYTFTLSSNSRVAGAISAYSGVDNTTPVDVAASATAGATTSHVAPSVTASGDDELLIVAFGVRTPTSFTMPSGTTERSDIGTSVGTNDITAGLGERPVNTGSTGTTTATSAAADYSATVTVALTPAATGTNTTVTRYGYTSTGDTADVILSNTSTILQRLIPLVGGVTVTLDTTNGDIWSYPDIQGSIIATTNDTGVQQGSSTIYDPDGNPATGAIPDNQQGNFDNAWLGGHQRPTEHAPGLRPVIEMGARIYDPILGRFLQVDPVQGGTTTNDYSYVRDPINHTDLTGMLFGIDCGVCESVGDVVSTVVNGTVAVAGDAAGVVGGATTSFVGSATSAAREWFATRRWGTVAGGVTNIGIGATKLVKASAAFIAIPVCGAPCAAYAAYQSAGAYKVVKGTRQVSSGIRQSCRPRCGPRRHARDYYDAVRPKGVMDWVSTFF